MANTTTHEPSPSPKPFEPRGQARLSVASRSWILARLDALLSESLRRAEPADRVRYRVMVGAACFLTLANALFILRSLQLRTVPYAALLAGIGYLGTLVLARRARTPTAPAMLLLVTLSIGLVGSIFVNKKPTGGEHAVNMLLPILAVYLVGPRRGLPITLLVFATVGLAHPYYRLQIGIDPSAFTAGNIWFGHLFAGICLLGAWGLSALHSTARNAAQASLERTLRELRDSESKLNSVLESTDDIVVSVDPQGRVITANSAAKLAYQRAGIVLEPGLPLFQNETPERRAEWEARLAQVLQGQRLRIEQVYGSEGSRIVMDISLHPIVGADGRVVGVTLFGHDVTARREAETRLGEMHRTLVDVSRQAGMAEVATGVLHNVGNTLNSVNISTSLVTERLRKSRISGLTKAAQLLREHASDIPSFLARDPQGQKLPAYLIALSDQLQEERDGMIQEMHALGESLEHIKSIVSMQQKHARTAGAVEQVAVPQLINEALRLHAVSFERLGIRVDRDYAEVPLIYVDRHKLLQILINLMGNARHALVESPRQDKCLGIHVRLSPSGEQLHIEVADNGVGIAPENLGRMFTQGFTTKKTGHGFGLHISALAAAEMKGRLTCTSPGPGQGATFTLELPMEAQA
ncbi:PAS domain-containing protein [Archangium violaceum]|uniref:two-component system sensor histidine kinase NtrB n=1 Tax=Archangium violaceum TaxID=83451 RepID=UPI00193BD2C0|nr:ATP-binding protein [Archangium violaceum]QRK06459.1 PAS domain-containing protein [Archangium violaceum]